MGIQKKNLLETHPELTKEWHPTKNNNLTLSDVSYGSNKIVWWKCPKCGHEWRAMIKERARGNYSCKKCHTREKNLTTTHPNLMKEWDYIKNQGIDPTTLTQGSNVRVWWKCSKCSHEWSATIASRTRGTGCPANGCRKYTHNFVDKNLTVTHPDLMKEWNYTKNQDIDPTTFTHGSGKKVWWICRHGHEWEATIGNRTANGSGCPVCAGRRIVVGFNDFATTYPEIAKEWNYEKNGELKPTNITAGSDRNVWWKCKEGHEWKATPNARVQGNGCPHCSKHGTSKKEIMLLYYVRKHIDENAEHRIKKEGVEFDVHIPLYNTLIEYDGAYAHKNKELKDKAKNLVAYKCGMPLYRLREKPLKSLDDTSIDTILNANKKTEFEHVVEEIIFIITGKKIHIQVDDDMAEINSLFERVERETSLATKYPDIAKQWHPTKNLKLKPENVPASSNMKVWWLGECGHEWQMPISHRTGQGQKCPYCSGKRVLAGFNDLGTVRPDIAKEWNYEKNGELVPKDITIGSHKKIWWKCQKGHEWYDTVNHRTSGCSCPVCANNRVLVGYNDFATTHPEIAKQWNFEKNGELKPTDVFSISVRKVWWKCEHGHEWTATINSRTHGVGCPICSRRKVLVGYNDLLTTHPEIAKEWNYEKNGELKPTDVMYGSYRKVWWINEEKGEWLASIYGRVRSQARHQSKQC